MKSFYLLVIASFAFISCAKNRGVDGLRLNQTEYWQPKSQYYGSRPDMRSPFYAKVTVVKNTNDGGFAAVGYQTDMRVGYFNFTRDSLQFISTQGAYRGRVGNELNDFSSIIEKDPNLNGAEWTKVRHRIKQRRSDVALITVS